MREHVYAVRYTVSAMMCADAEFSFNQLVAVTFVRRQLQVRAAVLFVPLKLLLVIVTRPHAAVLACEGGRVLDLQQCT